MWLVKLITGIKQLIEKGFKERFRGDKGRGCIYGVVIFQAITEVLVWELNRKQLGVMAKDGDVLARRPFRCLTQPGGEMRAALRNVLNFTRGEFPALGQVKLKCLQCM